MSAIVIFLVLIGAAAGWWLSQQRLMAKPWLDVGSLGDIPAWGGSSTPTVKVGLGIFLAVIGCLFALLISAYFMRIDIVTVSGIETNRVVFRAMPVPKMLWLNSGVLVVSSVALQWAEIAARQRQRAAARDGLLLAALSALVFLGGQLLVWRQLVDSGQYATSTPANAFFYLLTGTHGLHVAGGLVALGRTIAKAWRDISIDQLRLSVWLCAVYWHFLLLVWLIIFGLLMGWADDFIVICRALTI